MSPVRWKHVLVTITIALVQCVTVAVTDAQQMQDVISMTADGWRPIIGTRRQPSYNEEITHYRNPNINNENPKKAETVTPTTILTTISSAPKNPTKSAPSSIGGAYKKYGSKIPTKLAHPSQSFYNGVHGPHIPLNGMPGNRPLSVGPIKKFPQNNKFQHMQGNGKRVKPFRGQATAHSNREEVYAPAPNPGSYSFIAQGPNAVKTRDTPGILLGSAHYSISQPNSHIEYNNRYPAQNENIYQQFNTNPIQSYVFPKPQQVNDVHYTFKNQNDEYTRNLVPPPQPYKNYQDKESPKNKNVTPKDTNTVTQSTIQNSQYIKNSVPHNIGLQLPPPYEQNKFSYAQNEVKNNKQAIEVEVTKQKLKVFHNNIPSNYNPNTPDYIDYDYHTVKRPTNLPKLQTYEVTEGKQWQETPPFHYRFPGPQQVTQRPKKPTISRRPPVSPPKEELPLIELSRPILELSLPPFLPTPYKPEGIVPTSPTQEEVSTIFTQLSSKVKNHEYQTPSSHFFDVKEVSTHFPILGKPEIKPEYQTEYNPYRHQEITNEITTNNGEVENQREQITTVRPATRDPQRVRGSQRRRRPSNRLRVTTTEEPVQTENYDVQKTLETESEVSVETERPLRRRPNRYRTTTTETPVIEEITTRPVRVRNRNRQRIPSSSNESQTPRKRIRPTDMPSNHKMTQLDSDSSDYKQTTEELSFEQYPASIDENPGYSKETDITEEEVRVRPNRYEYDATNGRYPVQLEDFQKYQITSANNNLDLNKNEELNTEKSTTDIPPTTNIHMPDNEVDSTTPPNVYNQSPVTEHEIEEITIATTIPTTTTTEEATTTKTHRIRGRPVKYDSSNRPRFSVKDYRQRFASTSTTTESYKSTSTASSRVRFPNRSRRPFTSTTTTASPAVEDDEEEEHHTETMRSKFRPKEPRFSVTTENENIITEKNIKSVNTRLRPFGRQRSTTEATTSKISIKPNLFSQRRRPPPLSLKNRILNKLNKNQETTTTDPNFEDETESVGSSTVTYEVNTPDITTEIPTRKVTNDEEQATEDVETTTDILKNDPSLYSQRVSDLTSSFKNEYDTPGLFKNVSPTSRRIPNYFTIATDDPRLPIEAFFPNIKDVNKSE